MIMFGVYIVQGIHSDFNNSAQLIFFILVDLGCIMLVCHVVAHCPKWKFSECVGEFL